MIVVCILVENLLDVRMDSDVVVEFFFFLKEKWLVEGCLVEEEKVLDVFFEKIGYLWVFWFYIIKWLMDWICKYGIDGFWVDIVKYIEVGIWKELKEVCWMVFFEWKVVNLFKVLDVEDFYMVGEVYGY